jgi:hypothetical protein
MPENNTNYNPEISRNSDTESIRHHEEMLEHFRKMKEMISSFVTAEHHQNEADWIDKQIEEHQDRIKQLRGETDES